MKRKLLVIVITLSTLLYIGCASADNPTPLGEPSILSNLTSFVPSLHLTVELADGTLQEDITFSIDNFDPSFPIIIIHGVTNLADENETNTVLARIHAEPSQNYFHFFYSDTVGVDELEIFNPPGFGEVQTNVLGSGLLITNYGDDESVGNFEVTNSAGQLIGNFTRYFFRVEFAAPSVSDLATKTFLENDEYLKVSFDSLNQLAELTVNENTSPYPTITLFDLVNIPLKSDGSAATGILSLESPLLSNYYISRYPSLEAASFTDGDGTNAAAITPFEIVIGEGTPTNPVTTNQKIFTVTGNFNSFEVFNPTRDLLLQNPQGNLISNIAFQILDPSNPLAITLTGLTNSGEHSSPLGTLMLRDSEAFFDDESSFAQLPALTDPEGYGGTNILLGTVGINNTTTLLADPTLYEISVDFNGLPVAEQITASSINDLVIAQFDRTQTATLSLDSSTYPYPTITLSDLVNIPLKSDGSAATGILSLASPFSSDYYITKYPTFQAASFPDGVGTNVANISPFLIIIGEGTSNRPVTTNQTIFTVTGNFDPLEVFEPTRDLLLQDPQNNVISNIAFQILDPANPLAVTLTGLTNSGNHLDTLGILMLRESDAFFDANSSFTQLPALTDPEGYGGTNISLGTVQINNDIALVENPILYEISVDFNGLPVTEQITTSSINDLLIAQFDLTQTATLSLDSSTTPYPTITLEGLTNAISGSDGTLQLTTDARISEYFISSNPLSLVDVTFSDPDDASFGETNITPFDIIIGEGSRDNPVSTNQQRYTVTGVLAAKP